jgi:predicted nucleic acid-binding Zn ribbon protein
MQGNPERKCKVCGKLFLPDNNFQGLCSDSCYRMLKGEIKLKS